MRISIVLRPIGASQKHVHRDNARYASNGKSAQSPEFLPGSYVTLGKLFQGGIRGESRRRVGCLSRSCGHEALEETTNASLLEDQLAAMEEPPHARLGGLPVVNSKAVLSATKVYTRRKARRGPRTAES